MFEHLFAPIKIRDMELKLLTTLQEQKAVAH